MSTANIKLTSDRLKELKKLTGERTGQKAVEKALLYFLREAKQRKIINVLEKVSFQNNFNPLRIRKNER